MRNQGSVTRTLAPVIAASVVLRLSIAAGSGFGVDEAYAVTVARPLSLSYFDHPPLHFWMAGAMAFLTDDTSPFWMRLPFVLCFTITLSAIGALTARLFSLRAGVIAVAALASSGVLGVTAGTWVLPDGPLIAATSVAAWLLAPLLVSDDDETRRVDAAWRWITAGACLGLGLLSKYHAVLAAAGILLFLATSARARPWLQTRWPWIAAVVMMSCAVPIVLWNAQHDWASFAFQGARAIPSRWSAAPFLESVAGQLAWLLPWIGVPLAMSLASAVGRGPADRARWLCVCLACGPIVLFTGVTLGGARGLPHWQAPGWLFAFPLLGAWADDALTRGARWPRPWLVGSSALTTALVVLLLGQGKSGWLDGRLSPSARLADPTRDAVSWRAAVDAAVEAAVDDAKEDPIRAADGDAPPPLVLAARSWIQAGQIGVALRGRDIPVVCLCSDPHHFRWQHDSLQSRWTRVVLLDRWQPNKRGWQDAPAALTRDSLRVVVRDTSVLDRGVHVIRYDVERPGPALSSATRQSAARAAY